MITQIKLPTAEALQPLVTEALKDGAVTPADFIAAHCSGLVQVLAKTPLYYRNYGAYWWAVKNILITHGYGDLFLDDSEDITAKHCYIENDETTLCAAWFYANAMIEDGSVLMPVHTYMIEIDGEFEPFEYSIEDLDMEALNVNV